MQLFRLCLRPLLKALLSPLAPCSQFGAPLDVDDRFRVTPTGPQGISLYLETRFEAFGTF